MQHSLQFDILHNILTYLVIEIRFFENRTIMGISAFYSNFQEQLHNAYSYVLANIKPLLPQVISFHLSYSLPLYQLFTTKTRKDTCFQMHLYAIYMYYIHNSFLVCFWKHVSLRVVNAGKQAIA